MSEVTVEGLTLNELGFDPQALAARYQQERAKRLRKEGNAQYQEVEGKFEHFKVDTRADSDFKREPIDADVKVLIVGGGYGGLVTAVRLAEQGITDLRIVEKGVAYGGTWYWNQYPGVQCDVESYIYMPLLEELGYIPTEKYVHGPEILRHMDMIAQRWELNPKTHFQTEVKTMGWDEGESCWSVRTNRNDHFRARFVVTAIGVLHKPKLPGLAGIETFKGHSFHTSRWDYAYTGGDTTGNLSKLSDKTVGVIGTGATAVQILPYLTHSAKQVYIFQRTPSSVNVRNNRPTDDTFTNSLKPGWQRHRQENFNNILGGAMEKEDLVSDGWTDMKVMSILGGAGQKIDPAQRVKLMAMADFQKMEGIRKRVDEIVKDRKTAEKLKPWYMSMCKRPCFHDEYLQCFNQPNVELVDTDGKGVDRISEKGVVANGCEYPVDLLIYATGFETGTEWSRRSGIAATGRDGKTLTDKWTKGVSTLYGVQTRDFPNLFLISLAQAGFSANFVYTIETASKHITYVIAHCEEKGITHVEPTDEAEEGWVKRILEGSAQMMSFFRGCTPSYFNNEAQITETNSRGAVFSGGPSGWARVLEEWRRKRGLEGLQVNS